MLLTEKKTDQKRAEKLLKSVKNHQNWTFLATYTPDMVIIWPHMACLPIFLSHTTYTSHIPPHMGSNGRQIAVKYVKNVSLKLQITVFDIFLSKITNKWRNQPQNQ